jgi:protein-S-isoprenylcysteine O-methyltransferase Ste14
MDPTFKAMSYRQKLIKWASGNEGEGIPFWPIFIAVAVFEIGIPLLFFAAGFFIETLLHWGHNSFVIIRLTAAVLLITTGLVFVVSSYLVQVRIGKGTPLYTHPTRKLVISGPYRYTRNPMAFGRFLVYLSLAAAGFSPVMLALSVLFYLPFSLWYFKKYEEPELTERFGDEYLAYQRSTPLFLPMLKAR